MDPLVQTGSVLFSIVHVLCSTAFMYLSLLNTIQKLSEVPLLPFCLISNVSGRSLFLLRDKLPQGALIFSNSSLTSRSAYPLSPQSRSAYCSLVFLLTFCSLFRFPPFELIGATSATPVTFVPPKAPKKSGLIFSGLFCTLFKRL